MSTKTTGTNYFTKYTSTVNVALTNESGNAVLIACAAGSAPITAGFAVGCMMIATDTGAFYTNTGNTTTASFSLISASAITSPTAITDGTTTTGNALSINSSIITTGKIFRATNGNTTSFTTGASLFYGDMDVATVGNGLTITGTGIYTGTGLLVLTNNTAVTGKIAQINCTGLTTGQGLNILGGSAMTSGVLAKLDMGAAISGNGLAIITTGIYVSGANATGLINITATAASTTTGLLQVASVGLTSGSNTLLTGGGANMGATGKVLEIAMGAATAGLGLSILTSANYAGTGIAQISMLATTAGIGLLIKATKATFTTGRFISCSDATNEVFGIGANGHIHSTVGQTPTITLTLGNGISACALGTGASDTSGSITTTGTATGACTIDVTFGKTYTTAPKSVILTPANASAAALANNPWYISAVSATGFTVSVPTGGTYGATPSWYYVVIA